MLGAYATKKYETNEGESRKVENTMLECLRII